MGYWDSDLGEEGGYCDIYPAAMTTVELISTTGDPPPEGSITGMLYSKVKGTGGPRYSESSSVSQRNGAGCTARSMVQQSRQHCDTPSTHRGPKVQTMVFSAVAVE